MPTTLHSITPRVLIIHRALAPYRIDLFNRLTEAYRVDLYLEYGQPLEQDFNLSLQRDRIHFDYDLLAPGPQWAPNLRLDVVRLLRKPYDLILCSEFNALTALLYATRRLSRRPQPRIVSICDDNETVAAETLRRGSLQPKSWLLDRMDGVVMCDRLAMRSYQDYFVRGERRFHYLPIVQDEGYLRRQIGLTRPRATDLRSKYGIAPSDEVLLYVGRLDPVKNLPRLLSTFAEAYRDRPDVRLLLVGDGPETSMLRQCVYEYRMERQIIFAGKQEGLDLYAHYALGHALILPSTNELFGATVAEALAMGIPVAVSRVAGSRDLITTPERGYVLDPHDVLDIKRAMQHVLRVSRVRSAVDSRPESLLPASFDDYMNGLLVFLDGVLSHGRRP